MAEADTFRVVEDVFAERRRQVDDEEFTEKHDDYYAPDILARAGAYYALTDALRLGSAIWPWLPRHFKPTTRRRDLIKAAALIVAEIEKIDRKAPKKSKADI